MAITAVDRAGMGPIESVPTFFNNAALGTTPQQVTLPAPGDGRARIYKIKIVNSNATALLAWATVSKGAAAPTILADFSASGASHILPGGVEFFSIPTSMDLYWVASAAASSAGCTIVLLS